MDDFVSLFLSLVVLGTIIFVIAFAGAMAIPVGIGVGIIYFSRGYFLKNKSVVHDDTQALYEESKTVTPFPFFMYESILQKKVHPTCVDVGVKLYEYEGITPPPPPSSNFSAIEKARYRDTVRNHIDVCKNRQSGFIDNSVKMLREYVDPTPQGIFSSTVQMTPQKVVDLQLFCANHTSSFKKLFMQMEKNFDKQGVMPTDYKGDNVVWDYLRDTPLLALEYIETKINLKNRTYHTHILGGSGHGKTQLIQYMISKDLKEDCCVVVIDSQKQMIPKLAHLNTPLDDVTYLTPEHSLSLNLFDVDYENMKKQKDGEVLLNNAIELLEYVLSSLLESDLTPKQRVVFQFAIKLVVMIPEGNIDTFLHIMKDTNHYDYADVIDDMDKASRDFMRNEFGDKQFDGTKKEISWRIWNVMKNSTFARIFDTKENTVDMFEELSDRKLILIDTDKERLGQGAGTFGRLFIAMILQASQARFKGKHRPVYLYIDEAYEYFDANLETMLETARKANIGIILSHQYLDQIKNPKMRSSFLTNTATKIVGGVSDKDARAMGAEMHCPHTVISEQKDLHFAYHVKGEDDVYSIKVPTGVIENMPQTANYKALVNKMVEYYGVEEIEEEEMPSTKKRDKLKDIEDDYSTEPSSEL